MEIRLRALLVFHCLIFFPWLLSGCTTHCLTSLEVAQMDYNSKNYPRAFQDLMVPASKGDPEALYVMGYMYYYGIGTDKDQDLGRVLIRCAARKNYPPAVTALKLILKSRHEQYVPLENYNANDEGIIKNIPRIRKGRS